MQNKRGGIGFVAGIILTILIVGALAFIVFGSIKKSSTDIFESLKKYIGIETPKAEASTKIDECIIKRYYWSKNSAKINDKVQIIVEGSGNCGNKKVNIDIYIDIARWPDDTKDAISTTFDENKASADWIVASTSVKKSRLNGYYFKVKLGDYTSSESERLKIE